MTTYIEGVDFSNWKNNRVIEMMVTSSGSQASGAVAPVWKIAMSRGYYLVGGTLVAQDADVAAFDIKFVAGPAYTEPPVLAVGQSCKAAIVGVTNGWCAVYGTPATTGAELVPNDTEIRAALVGYGYSSTYVRIGNVTINRTGDTTVTNAWSNLWKDV